MAQWPQSAEVREHLIVPSTASRQSRHMFLHTAKPVRVCSHLKHIFYTLAVMTQQVLLRKWWDMSPGSGLFNLCLNTALQQPQIWISKWLHLAQIYLWIQISFPTLCLFIPPCVTTWVTHVWVTSQKSRGEFSALRSCSNLVLFDDSTLDGSLYILTPPNNFFFASFQFPKMIEIHCHCPEMLHEETTTSETCIIY